jgi:hypothetical protein
MHGEIGAVSSLAACAAFYRAHGLSREDNDVLVFWAVEVVERKGQKLLPIILESAECHFDETFARFCLA